jgi:hypothetical protein
VTRRKPKDAEVAPLTRLAMKVRQFKTIEVVAIFAKTTKQWPTNFMRKAWLKTLRGKPLKKTHIMVRARRLTVHMNLPANLTSTQGQNND